MGAQKNRQVGSPLAASALAGLRERQVKDLLIWMMKAREVDGGGNHRCCLLGVLGDVGVSSAIAVIYQRGHAVTGVTAAVGGVCGRGGVEDVRPALRGMVVNVALLVVVVVVGVEVHGRVRPGASAPEVQVAVSWGAGDVDVGFPAFSGRGGAAGEVGDARPSASVRAIHLG